MLSIIYHLLESLCPSTLERPQAWSLHSDGDKSSRLGRQSVPHPDAQFCTHAGMRSTGLSLF